MPPEKRQNYTHYQKTHMLFFLGLVEGNISTRPSTLVSHRVAPLRLPWASPTSMTEAGGAIAGVGPNLGDHSLMGLVQGNTHGKPPYFRGKTVVSMIFPETKPLIHRTYGGNIMKYMVKMRLRTMNKHDPLGFSVTAPSLKKGSNLQTSENWDLWKDCKDTIIHNNPETNRAGMP